MMMNLLAYDSFPSTNIKGTDKTTQMNCQEVVQSKESNTFNGSKHQEPVMLGGDWSRQGLATLGCPALAPGFSLGVPPPGGASLPWMISKRLKVFSQMLDVNDPDMAMGQY